MQKSHPKVVNPRDIAGERKKKKKKKRRKWSASRQNAEDEKVEQLYDDIERAMANSGSKYKIVTGDFNAKMKLKQKKTSETWEQLE